jgi:hypothetical protein
MGWVESIVSKVSPRVVAIAVLIAVCSLCGMTMYAVASGQPVEAWGWKIGGRQTPLPVAPTPLVDDSCKTELESEKQLRYKADSELKHAITRSELGDLWPENQSKGEVLATLQQRSAQVACPDDDTANCRFEKLRNMIGQYSGQIDVVRLQQKRVTQLIQQVLADVRWYEGEIDGDAVKTKEQLKRFQRQYSIRTNTSTFEGLMGNKTLNRIEALHKEQVEET